MAEFNTRPKFSHLLRRFYASINRERATSDQKEKYRAEKHAVVCPRFMRHAPKACRGQHGNLGSDYGNADVDDQGNRSQSCDKTDNQKRSTNYFNNPNKRREELWGRNADFYEASYA